MMLLFTQSRCQAFIDTKPIVPAAFARKKTIFGQYLHDMVLKPPRNRLFACKRGRNCPRCATMMLLGRSLCLNSYGPEVLFSKMLHALLSGSWAFADGKEG